MKSMRVWNWLLAGCAFALLVSTVGVPHVHGDPIEMDSEIYASLSGFVYCDINNSGTYDSGEEKIRDVLIILDGLIDEIDPDSPEAQAWGVGQRPLDPGEKETHQRITWTDSYGNYSFDYLLPGTYTVTEVTPYMFVEGKPNAAGNLGGQVVTSNQYAEVVVAPLDEGTGYNFGEWGLKTRYISKRSLIVVVPEPSTMVLLAGICLLFTYRRRH